MAQTNNEINSDCDEMIGQRFGRLVVLRLDEEQTLKNENHAKSYVCQCDCGNVKTVRKSNLKNGQTTSCGCIVKENGHKNTNRFVDITGQRFGKLTVIGRKENDPNDPIKQRRIGAWWYCNCDCGTKDFVAKGAYLRAGRVQSCGCYNKEASHNKNMIDLTGQRYGQLTVLEEVPDIRRSGSIVWRCICDCGNEALVSANALRTGNTISCGCVSSKNEWIIKNHLQTLGIKYIPQYWFDDLRSPITNWVLKFDVAVIDDDENIIFIIEYDGEQHEFGTRFSPDPKVNEEKFKKTQLYDKIKNEYCEEHNIDLLRISFRDKDNIIDIINNKLKEKGLLNNGIQETSSK